VNGSLPCSVGGTPTRIAGQLSPESERRSVSDDIETAVEQFLADTDTALSEYDKGYADADATLRVLRDHLDDLRDAVET